MSLASPTLCAPAFPCLLWPIFGLPLWAVFSGVFLEFPAFVGGLLADLPPPGYRSLLSRCERADELRVLRAALRRIIRPIRVRVVNRVSR